MCEGCCGVSGKALPLVRSKSHQEAVYTQLMEECDFSSLTRLCIHPTHTHRLYSFLYLEFIYTPATYKSTLLTHTSANSEGERAKTTLY